MDGARFSPVMGTPLEPREPSPPPAPASPSVKAIVLGDRAEVLSALDAMLHAEGAQIVEQTADPRDLPEDAGPRADVVFIETVGFHGSRWKELLRDARRRLPGARFVLVAPGPETAIEEPARAEGADAVVQYPIQADALGEVLRKLFPSATFRPKPGVASGAYTSQQEH